MVSYRLNSVEKYQYWCVNHHTNFIPWNS